MRRIGFLVEANPRSYSRALRTVLSAQAAAASLELISREVHWPEDPDAVRPDDSSGILASCSEFDAIILPSGVFSRSVGVLSRFAQHWAPKPLVSIGYRLPGIASVVLDNRAAQKSAALHLITRHGCERPLYLRGRRDNLEAEERYLGFRRALHEQGILFKSDLVIDGDFTLEGASRAFARLAPRLSFDGVIAANDDMALGVMNELLAGGRRVPTEVPVIGFDDVELARAAPVPLSSMAQPFDGFARQALASLRRQVSDPDAHQVSTVDAELVARASCGC